MKAITHAKKIVSKFRKESARDTDFSNFFNNAKSGERKKVFERIMEGAASRQEAILKEVSTS